MRVLTRFFKKSQSAEKTVKHKKEVDLASLSQSELCKRLEDQKEVSLQIKMIKLIESGEFLCEWLLRPTKVDDAVSEVLCKRIALLLNEQKFSVDQIESLLPFNQQCSVLENCTIEQVVLAKFEQWADVRCWYQLALNGATSSLRQAAAAHIDSESLLLQLAKESKGRDKSVYRIVSDQLKQLKQKELLQLQRDEKLTGLHSALLHLQRHSYDPQFVSKLKLLEQQWTEMATYTDETQCQEIEFALNSCRELASAIESDAAKLQEQKQALAAQHQNRESVLSELCALFTQLVTSEITVPQWFEKSGDKLEQLRERWSQLDKVNQADNKQQQRFEMFTDGIAQYATELLTFHSLSDIHNLVSSESAEAEPAIRLLKKIARFMDSAGFESAASANVKEMIALWQQQQSLKEAEVSQTIKQISGLLRKGGDALAQGQLRRAAGIGRTLSDKSQQCGALLPESMQKRIEEYREQLQKLQDWQDFAAVPKKESLIKQMSDLIGSELEPQVLAEQIQWLQKEWQNLSKGSKDQHQTLREQFHEAAQKAYEPCRLYFEQMAKSRDENLQQRKSLVSLLQQYLDSVSWEQVDWKGVENLIQTAKNEWRRAAPVDRQAGRAVERTFEKQLTVIQEKLEGVYQSNIEQKELLIKKAEELDAIDDLNFATQQVKQLQSQWQSVGLTPRRADQKLWQRFRGGCNRIFEKKAVQYQQSVEQMENNRTVALSLIESLTQLSALHGAALIDAEDNVAQLVHQFNELGNLPRGDFQSLREQFNAQLNRYKQNLAELHKTNKARQWQQLFELNEMVNSYALKSDPVLKERIDSCFHAGELPKESVALLAKWQRLGDVSDELLRQNADKLKELCLRMEIANDKATPKDALEERVAYQFKVLQQEFGQRHNDDAGQLRKAWLEVGPVSEQLYKMLFQRFIAAL